MRETRNQRKNRAPLLWLAALSVSGCDTRDRLIFPSDPGQTGDGPVSTIDRPLADTTVTAGPGFTVTGRVTDGDGLDTVYYETDGGVSSFPPSVNDGTTLRFGVPLTTNQLAGDTITIRIFATDLRGNRGDTAIRRIAIQ